MPKSKSPDMSIQGLSRRSFGQSAAAGLGVAAWVGSGANVALGQPVPAPTKTAKRAVRLAHLTDVHVQPEHALKSGNICTSNSLRNPPYIYLPVPLLNQLHMPVHPVALVWPLLPACVVAFG